MAPGILSGPNGHGSGSDPASPVRDTTGWSCTSTSNGSRSVQPPFSLQTPAIDEVHDLVCVGFGPASLAIAVALHDSLQHRHEGESNCLAPKVRFLERQYAFKWHAGMLLPGAKMQISFIKDLATLRDPTSHFTFLNYLKQHDRLVQFSNLGTFLPSRLEFDDYLQWAASHFENVVEYGQEVEGIFPHKPAGKNASDCFEIVSRNLSSGAILRLLSRNVVIAAGGRPATPAVFPPFHPRILHSSEFNTRIEHLLSNKNEAYHIGVVGGGQSAAEVFSNLHSRYPNATTRMIFRDSALRPSDDSPFVNEVFNPEAVDTFFEQPENFRSASLKKNKATNYSVVRLELLERIYDDLYLQSIKQPDKERWQHQLLPSREILEVVDNEAHEKVDLRLRNLDPLHDGSEERQSFDAVIMATGYRRDAHIDMLKPCQSINADPTGEWQAGRDYGLKLNRTCMDEGTGIWLQGCNEDTHGLSDTLLSILSTRSGELVHSIFTPKRGLHVP